jgi:hypothetical protein
MTERFFMPQSVFIQLIGPVLTGAANKPFRGLGIAINSDQSQTNIGERMDYEPYQQADTYAAQGSATPFVTSRSDP